MRKIVFQILALAVTTGGLVSCGDRKNTEATNEVVSSTDEWTMMDEFHMVMAEAFHPYKDSANLQPAKEQASNMAAVATRWADAPLPERVNNETVRSKINQLKDDVIAFEETVRTESDDVIGESLNTLHDQFHELQDAWYHSAEDHAGHDH